jgi:serine/threonine-protein phosphatase 2A regulatory subunit A
MRQIVGQVKVKDYENYLMQMIHRLSRSDNSNNCYAVVHMIPVLYPHFSAANQTSLFETLLRVTDDQSPHIRKQASIVVNDMIPKIPAVFPEKEVLSIFNKINSADQEHDSVRFHGIEGCISFAQVLPKDKLDSSIIPLALKYAKDESWRIRYLAADKIVELCKAVGPERTVQHFLPVFVSFLSDKETEVRAVSLNNLGDFCKMIPSEKVSSEIIPCLSNLEKASSELV